MNGLAWWPEAGAAGLVIVVVGLCLKYAKDQRDAFLVVISNHIKHSDETLNRLCVVIEKLATKIDAVL